MLEENDAPLHGDLLDCLDSEQLGKFLGLGSPDRPGSAARAIQARSERGHPLPPFVSLPGHRGRLWLRATVLRWLSSYEVPAGRRIGRPRKIDAIAMKRAPKKADKHKSSKTGIAPASHVLSKEAV